MTEILPSLPSRPVSPRSTAQSLPATRAAAHKLEATFLAQMLKSAGFGQDGGFAGGIGEQQFASFQRQAIADEMVKAGGLGLADSFYQSMMEMSDDT